MRKLYTSTLVAVFYICSIYQSSIANSYVWNGSNNSSWNNNLNWTPNTGFPTASDNATLNSSGFSPILDASRSVTNLTISSGTLSLNTFTITCTGIGVFSNGNVTNGTISATGTSVTFSGTTIGAIIYVSTESIYLNGSIFNNTSSFIKTGPLNDVCNGGNTFNGVTAITNTGDGYLRLANTNPDSYNNSITFNQTGGGALTPAYNSNCTFSSDISTVGSAIQIIFGSGSSSKVTINGSSIQNFYGDISTKPIIKRLVMSTSGSGYLKLNTPVDINIDLNMIYGNIVTDSINILTLNNNATANIGNANSFVNGKLAYEMAYAGLRTLIFPIGKNSDWNPIEVTANHNTAAFPYTYVAEMFNASAKNLGWTLPSTVDLVSDIHYWDVKRYFIGSLDPTSRLSGNQGIKIYYNGKDGVSDPSNLTICKNTYTATTTWVDIGGAGATANSGYVSSTSSPTAFTSFSRFTLANRNGGINPLPVELLSFNATANRNSVNINWSTASEFNSDYFMVQRSKDGIYFEDVNKVTAAGNSNTIKNYPCIDYHPYNGISYYRLKQVDFDGDFVYSKICTVNINSNPQFIITQEEEENITINISGCTANEKIYLLLTDIQGKTIYSELAMCDDNGTTTNKIENNNISSGIYIASAHTTSNANYTSKFIIIGIIFE